MLYMAIIANQKSQQAGIPLFPKQTFAIVGTYCTSKTLSVRLRLSKQAVTPEHKNCGEKTPRGSVWVGINSDFVCPSSTRGRHRWALALVGGCLAEQEATAVFGT